MSIGGMHEQFRVEMSSTLRLYIAIVEEKARTAYYADATNGMHDENERHAFGGDVKEEENIERK